ncbi:substrate-binding domain-containing protein [Acaryochloris sp. IP29b_bin.137]|uniref:PstS family phosphate ABC transporter substrate-binding protein n=1 Tax=Acaryochloris sp. IP29b_bin.137 TaxID=2969217 RepID=UPI00260B95AD|nr:substrate-binding domain-containing protein [Acaryochloris sp. IP29b_bin.137]
MNQDLDKNKRYWQRWGLPGLTLLTLIWCLGLLGIGVWQWKRHTAGSEVTPTSPQQPAFKSVQNVPVGTFRYGGSPVWAPIRLLVDATIQAERREFQLRHVASGQARDNSNTGIQMLLAGQLDFVQSARPLTEQERQLAKQQGFQLLEIPVAIDGLTVAVHPDLPVAGLTVDQLQAIYTGQIDNWQDVNGPDLPIIPYSQPLRANSTVNLLTESVLQQASFASRIQFVSTTTEALRKVARHSGGIYYASVSEILSQCTVKPLPLGLQTDNLIPPYQAPLTPIKQCLAQRPTVNSKVFQSGQYPLTRYLYVIIKQNNQIEERAGQAYAQLLLTAQGQAMMAQAGVVPLR